MKTSRPQRMRRLCAAAFLLCAGTAVSAQVAFEYDRPQAAVGWYNGWLGGNDSVGTDAPYCWLELAPTEPDLSTNYGSCSSTSHFNPELLSIAQARSYGAGVTKTTPANDDTFTASIPAGTTTEALARANDSYVDFTFTMSAHAEFQSYGYRTKGATPTFSFAMDLIDQATSTAQVLVSDTAYNAGPRTNNRLATNALTLDKGETYTVRVYLYSTTGTSIELDDFSLFMRPAKPQIVIRTVSNNGTGAFSYDLTGTDPTSGQGETTVAGTPVVVDADPATAGEQNFTIPTPASAVTVQQASPAASSAGTWSLTALTCERDGVAVGTANLDDASVSIDAADAEGQIVCTFTNLLIPVQAGNDTITATAGQTVTENLLTNDNVEGTAATVGASGNAEISTVGTWPTGITLDTATGDVTIAPTVPAGTYTAQYQLCQQGSTTNCVTATITFTVRDANNIQAVPTLSHLGLLLTGGLIGLATARRRKKK